LSGEYNRRRDEKQEESSHSVAIVYAFSAWANRQLSSVVCARVSTLGAITAS
jgi:hypothetical protein